MIAGKVNYENLQIQRHRRRQPCFHPGAIRKRSMGRIKQNHCVKMQISRHPQPGGLEKAGCNFESHFTFLKNEKRHENKND